MKIQKNKRSTKQYKKVRDPVGEYEGNQLPLAKLNKKLISELSNMNSVIIGAGCNGKHREEKADGNRKS
ncbi:hypothetical protein [Enterococcus termitis]|uniref:Uncharacterized protein n=1 Tax=Enterococcus termitis TaxID=332950 RepID=A0A1E5H0Y7_9ENTE|nr:hypothetical protein [Enterococcus termitis]OEG18689.1 hypothetical protein BCR25_15940 [Enterococcus termitis]